MATTFQSPLASKGLTVLMITALNNKVTTFDNDLDIQDDAIRLRDSSTEDRIELGNEVYKKNSGAFLLWKRLLDNPR